MRISSGCGGLLLRPHILKKFGTANLRPAPSRFELESWDLTLSVSGSWDCPVIEAGCPRPSNRDKGAIFERDSDMLGCRCPASTSISTLVLVLALTTPSFELPPLSMRDRCIRSARSLSMSVRSKVIFFSQRGPRSVYTVRWVPICTTQVKRLRWRYRGFSTR